MNKPDSRVVATTCADHAAGETGYVTFSAPVPFGTKLTLQSALHAAEAEHAKEVNALSKLANDNGQLANNYMRELGELRRRVSELASDLVVLAKHHEIRADRPYQDEGTTNWHSGYDEGITECADRLRQLLASDGGADGDRA